MWGVRFFLAQETAVNQIVKDEVFLSSRLEWISPSSVSTQKSLAGWKVSSACLHLDWRRGSVRCTFKVIASRFLSRLYFFFSTVPLSSLPTSCWTHIALKPTGYYHPCLLVFSSLFLGQTLLCALNEDSRVGVVLLKEHSFVVIPGLSTFLSYLQYRFTWPPILLFHYWRSHLLTLVLLDRKGLYIVMQTFRFLHIICRQQFMHFNVKTDYWDMKYM